VPEHRQPGDEPHAAGVAGVQEEAEQILVRVVGARVAGVFRFVHRPVFRIVGLEEDGVDASPLPGRHRGIHEGIDGLPEVIVIGGVEPDTLDSPGGEVRDRGGFPPAARQPDRRQQHRAQQRAARPDRSEWESRKSGPIAGSRSL
jgi:hypothetical protein